VAVGKRQGSRSAKRFAAYKGRRLGTWARIKNGQGTFRQTIDAAIHPVETVIERQETHAAKQPWRRRLHHGWIAIQAGDHEDALPHRWRRAIGRAQAHASLYSIPPRLLATDHNTYSGRETTCRVAEHGYPGPWNSKWVPTRTQLEAYVAAFRSRQEV
jgi:hypothetical protein